MQTKYFAVLWIGLSRLRWYDNAVGKAIQLHRRDGSLPAQAYIGPFYIRIGRFL